MAYTPGPWIVVDFDIRDKEHGHAIAAAWGRPDEDWDNANAIAAVPEMIEALEAFITAWEQSRQLEKTDVALRLAKAAIAKVRGEEAPPA